MHEIGNNMTTMLSRSLYGWLSKSAKKYDEIYDGLEKLGEEIGVIIKIQHESIFESMHRV